MATLAQQLLNLDPFGLWLSDAFELVESIRKGQNNLIGYSMRAM
jgi:hypothetical protein